MRVKSLCLFIALFLNQAFAHADDFVSVQISGNEYQEIQPIFNCIAAQSCFFNPYYTLRPGYGPTLHFKLPAGEYAAIEAACITPVTRTRDEDKLIDIKSFQVLATQLNALALQPAPVMLTKLTADQQSTLLETIRHQDKNEIVQTVMNAYGFTYHDYDIAISGNGRTATTSIDETSGKKVVHFTRDLFNDDPFCENELVYRHEGEHIAQKIHFQECLQKNPTAEPASITFNDHNVREFAAHANDLMNLHQVCDEPFAGQIELRIIHEIDRYQKYLLKNSP